MLKTQNILGVSITNETEDKISEYILSSLKTSKKKFFVVTPNPEILVYASKHLAYQYKLNKAEASLPDGGGLLWAGKVLGKPLKTRIPGVDFIEKLCRDSKEKPVSMGFLGGRAGVAERAAGCLQQKYPWIKIGFVGEQWPTDLGQGPVRTFPPTSAPSHRELRAVGSPSSPATLQNNDSTTSNNVSSMENQKNKNTKYLLHNTEIDILFVAFGAPKQEEWIYVNLDKLPVKMAMGVGGAFDYLSGAIPRAPKSLRSLGLEWLFRLIIQPWRFKRQLALIEFVILVLKEKFVRNR